MKHRVALAYLHRAGCSQSKLRHIYKISGGRPASFLATAVTSDWLEVGIPIQDLPEFLKRLRSTSMQELERCLRLHGVRIIVEGDEEYPECFSYVVQPPFLVYARGSLDVLERETISIVGARLMTGYGKEALVSTCGPLIRAGVVVVSGLAEGVDAASHRYALDCRTPSVAVLPSDLLSIYPRRHVRLAESLVASGGLLLSEFPVDSGLAPWHFHKRNRLISSLSDVLVVVEAKEKSGSLITARHAVEQGKEVFAIPGSIYAALSKGTNRLLERGEAHPLIEVSQLERFFGASLKQELPKQVASSFISTSPMFPEDIAEEQGCSVEEVLQEMSLLELEGVLHRTQDGRVFKRG